MVARRDVAALLVVCLNLGAGCTQRLAATLSCEAARSVVPGMAMDDVQQRLGEPALVQRIVIIDPATTPPARIPVEEWLYYVPVTGTPSFLFARRDRFKVTFRAEQVMWVYATRQGLGSDDDVVITRGHSRPSEPISNYEGPQFREMFQCGADDAL